MNDILLSQARLHTRAAVCGYCPEISAHSVVYIAYSSDRRYALRRHMLRNEREGMVNAYINTYSSLPELTCDKFIFCGDFSVTGSSCLLNE